MKMFGLMSLAPGLAFSAWVHFDPADTSKVPKLFSQTGFYANMSAKTVTPEAVPFEVNSALWSDNAHKSRWVLLKPGPDKIVFDAAKDYYDYPDGAVFVKLFRHDTIAGDTSSRIYWETRVLVNKKIPDTLSPEPIQVVIRDKWYPFSYRWNPGGLDAQLVSANSGAVASMDLTVNGQKTFRKWVFPSAQACDRCHRQYGNGTQGRAVLGFFTPQLNRAVAGYPNLNQIRNLFEKNILTWALATPAPTEAQIGAMPKWAAINDTAAPLDLRAKAYIAANCSGCHGTRGIGTNGIYPGRDELNYDFINQTGGQLAWTVNLTQVSSQEYDGMPTVMGPGGVPLQPGLIVPGHPEISTVLFRMKVRNRADPGEETAYYSLPAQMPPLSVFEEDTVATRWLQKWIAEMPPAGIRKPDGRGLEAVRMVGNTLNLPGGNASRVFVSSAGGRRFELPRLEGNTYRIPDDLPRGLLFLRHGNRSYKLIR
jgi:cytochrome c553